MKNILIDASVLSFRAIHNWVLLQSKKAEGQLVLPSHYTYMSMVISVLKKIGVNKDDRIILALDGKNSWRKAFMSSYKAQRKGQRDKVDVDWKAHWNKIEEVNQTLHNYSQIHVMKLNDVFSYEDLINSEEGQKFIEPNPENFGAYYGIEGDDIISQAVRFFDEDCVVVTIDKDVYMLDYLDNVKIFSMNLRTPKGKNGAYVTDCQPLKILADKCRLGDASDNILVDKQFPEKDSELRRFVIDLLNLPSFLKEPIEEELKLVKPKENQYDKLPFQNSLAKRFKEIYTDKNLVTWDYCVAYKERKKKHKKKKAKQNV